MPGQRMMSLTTISARTLLIVLWCSSGAPPLAQIPLPSGTEKLPEANRRVLTAVCSNAGKSATISATMSDRFDREAFRKLENAIAPTVLSGQYEQTLSPDFIAVGDGQFRDASTTMVVIPGSKTKESLFRISLGKYDASVLQKSVDYQPIPGDIVHFRSRSGKSQFFATIYGEGNPSRTPKVKSTLLIFNYTGLLEATESKKFNSLELNSFPPRITDRLLRAAYPELYGNRLRSGLRKLLFERNNGYAEARLGSRLLKGVYAGYYMRSQLWVNKDLEYRVLRRNSRPPKARVVYKDSLSARERIVSQYAFDVLTMVMENAGCSTGVITSTIRTPEEQVDIMYRNAKEDLGAQYALYGQDGHSVLKIYEDNESKPEAEVKSLMLDKVEGLLNENPPRRVSLHVATPESYKLKNIIDVGVSSTKAAAGASFDMAKITAAFEQAKVDGFIYYFKDETKISNNCWHVEIVPNTKPLPK